MRDEFGYLNGKFMTNHEILANRVNRVTYEDGIADPGQLQSRAVQRARRDDVAAYSYVLRKPGA